MSLAEARAGAQAERPKRTWCTQGLRRNVVLVEHKTQGGTEADRLGQ